MRFLLLLALLAIGGCASDLGPSQGNSGRSGMRRTCFRKATSRICWRFCAPISTIPAISARRAFRSRTQDRRPGPTLRRLRALQRAQQRWQICGLHGRCRGLCRRASSTASSTASRRSPIARTPPTRRFPNWSVSRASAVLAPIDARLPPGLSGSAVESSDKEAESKRGRRGHLTLRFSADVFPRFSTSSN